MLELIALDPFRLLNPETGEIISTFAGGDGGGPSPPPVEEKTPEELDLIKKQTEAADLSNKLAQENAEYARESRAREDALAPVLYKQYGIQMQKNPDGSYTAVEAPKSDLEQQDEQIRKLANERTLKAFQGNLDVDPSVEADLTRSKAQLEEELARRGIRKGSGDSYNRAMAEFDRMANSLRYDVRRGEMTSSDAIARGRTMENLDRSNRYLSNAREGRRSTSADLIAGSSLVGGSARAFGDVADRYATDRYKKADYQFQSDMMTAQGNQMLTQGAIAGGSRIGAALLMPRG
jgi:hypothetical protein